jgi:hypothetical protein
MTLLNKGLKYNLNVKPKNWITDRSRNSRGTVLKLLLHCNVVETC